MLETYVGTPIFMAPEVTGLTAVSKCQWEIIRNTQVPGGLPQRSQLQWDQAPQDQPELKDLRRGDNEAPLATRVTGKPPA